MLDVADYEGGVGVWGAVPPVYDTTPLPLDRGVHVHARRKGNDSKDIDQTYRAVRVIDRRGDQPDGVLISELDAIYFMVSSIFDFSMKYVACLHCRWPHLDKDWFSVHPHRGHLCAGCGKHFRDVEAAIGNPAWAVHEKYRTTSKKHVEGKPLRLRQADHPGGIRIWGSNPAIIWTGRKAEDEGVHVHAFCSKKELPQLDGTFASVEIDGVPLKPHLIRALMAQSALPHIAGRVVHLTCDRCGQDHHDDGAFAYTPRSSRPCARCKAPVRSQGRLRNTIGNPILQSLREIGSFAVRPPRQHDIGLLPETL